MDGNFRTKREARYGVTLFLMVLTHVLVHCAGNIRSTLFPVLKDEFSLSNQQIGLILAIPTLCQMVFSIPTGLLSDRFGAKKLIAMSILMAAGGAALASISVDPTMYIIASTLLILDSTTYHPPAQSYVASITEPKNRSRALGFWNGGGTFGVSLGPLSVTILMGVFMLGWRQTYAFWVFPILFGLVALYFVKDSTETVERRLAREETETGSAKKLLNRNMIMFLTASAVGSFGASLSGGFLSIWLAEDLGWNLSEIGLMFGISSMMGIFVSPLGGEFADRFGEKRWIVVTTFVSYTCFLVAILLRGFWPFLIFYLAERFFGIMAMAANASLTAKLSPPRRRGIGFALSAVPGSLVSTMGAMIAAYVADLFGLYPLFLATTMIHYVGLGILQFGVRTD